MMRRKKWLSLLIVSLTILGEIAFFFLFSITVCPIKRITGFPCPGCGMTRAVLCALRGDFSSAFAAHPLFPILPVFLCAIAWYSLGAFSSVKQKKWCEGILFALAILMIAVWILRLCLGWRD